MIAKQNILFILLILFLLTDCLAQTPGGEMKPLQSPVGFPVSNYTPYGYLDNPYHSMVHNRSGVIRSVPPLGFGFWKRQFRGSYGEGPRGYVNYLSLLQISVTIDTTRFIETDDFTKYGVKLYSAYHSKNIMSYDWRHEGVVFSLKYFLPRENSLVCLAEIENLSGAEKKIVVQVTNIYGLWETKWWGSNGLTAHYDPDMDAIVSKIWAYGDVFILAADWHSIARYATGSRKEWREWQCNGVKENRIRQIIKGPGPLYNVLHYELMLPPGSSKSGMVYLCRGKNEEWARAQLSVTRTRALDVLKQQLALDEQFWSQCPKLVGDWPLSWKHGWVYDWETLRMNIRRPIGIFKHPWDAMQVHSPRVVLGETALDMLTMSYANPKLAKEVLFGTFADALAPNVPCAREDGSVNMIGADGSECGTAPMWGFPFHVIQIIYEATGDTVWLKQLYPHLKAYLRWWLENRTDEEGWFHCNNSWESGQDGSRRFLVKGEGDPAEFVRTVDVEASMAEAMLIMKKFAPIAGNSADTTLWHNLARRRVQNTRSMFFKGKFRDVDGRNKQPIILRDFYDVMFLSPLTCGIATEEQMKAVKPLFRFYMDNPFWLQWPPKVFAFCEAAWNAGKQLAAAEAVMQIADRIYRRTDSRKLMFVEKDSAFSYRIPGVANEFWPVDFRPPGAENYGWGATLPTQILRNIIGFRETADYAGTAFYLAPAIPEKFAVVGKKYGVSNLHFRGVSANVFYQMKDAGKIKITLAFTAKKPGEATVLNESGEDIFLTSSKKKEGKIEFEGTNGSRYLIKFY